MLLANVVFGAGMSGLSDRVDRMLDNCKVAGAAGLEPATLGFGDCSIPLQHLLDFTSACLPIHLKSLSFLALLWALAAIILTFVGKMSANLLRQRGMIRCAKSLRKSWVPTHHGGTGLDSRMTDAKRTPLIGWRSC